MILPTDPVELIMGPSLLKAPSAPGKKPMESNGHARSPAESVAGPMVFRAAQHIGSPRALPAFGRSDLGGAVGCWEEGGAVGRPASECRSLPRPPRAFGAWAPCRGPVGPPTLTAAVLTEPGKLLPPLATRASQHFRRPHRFSADIALHTALLPPQRQTI
eukprot:jgi/Ulvmu1/7747/UM039_0055.1